MTLPLTGAILGLVLLLWSADRFVEGSAVTARHFGMPPLLVGMLVVGFGTSLPEMIVSALAAADGNSGIALGNVLGSNLFNTLAVAGLAATIQPLTAAPEVLSRDLPVMGVLTLSLFVLGCGFRGPGRINRVEGGLLLAGYLAYTLWLLAAAGRTL